jgi:hypothetical protein
MCECTLYTQIRIKVSLLSVNYRWLLRFLPTKNIVNLEKKIHEFKNGCQMMNLMKHSTHVSRAGLFTRHNA